MSGFEAFLPKERVRKFIAQWMIEDCPAFDVAGAVVETATSNGGHRRALITCKSTEVVICGLWLAREIFDYFQCEYALCIRGE